MVACGSLCSIVVACGALLLLCVRATQVVVSPREAAQLESWTKRVARERVSLDALVHENERRSINHERQFFAAVAESSGKNVLDRVYRAGDKLSRARLARMPAPDVQKARNQRAVLLGTKFAPKLMRKTLGYS